MADVGDKFVFMLFGQRLAADVFKYGDAIADLTRFEITGPAPAAHHSLTSAGLQQRGIDKQVFTAQCRHRR